MTINGIDYYVVFTRKLRNKLKDQGYEVRGRLPNKDKPWLDIYLFESTDELKDEIDRLRIAER